MEVKLNGSGIYFEQPRYFKDFKCVGGNCSTTCCANLGIFWRKDEVEKIRNSGCSEELLAAADKAFSSPDINGVYNVNLVDNKTCPFLNEDGLCMIQKELGEDYLSAFCSDYPRKNVLMGDMILSYCNMACSHILDMICSNKDSMKLDNYSAYNRDGAHTVHFITDSPESIKNNPELKYRKELFEFFYEILSDESRSIETSIALGAFAAEGLAKLVKDTGCDAIPKAIEVYKEQINDPSQIKEIEELEPNHAMLIKLANELDIQLVDSNMTELLAEDGKISVEKYLQGVKKFNDCFADRPFVLRNIALNLFMECNVPFENRIISIFARYCYFAAAFAFIKYVASAVFLSSDSEKAFKDVLSYLLGRAFIQNSAAIEIVAGILKELGYVTPTHIALLVK